MDLIKMKKHLRTIGRHDLKTEFMTKDTLPNADLDITLDPQDWNKIRKLGHLMIDDIMDYLENIRDKPVWRPIPKEVKIRFQTDIPYKPADIEDVYDEFKTTIFPYPKGNIHPRFFAW